MSAAFMPQHAAFPPYMMMPSAHSTAATIATATDMLSPHSSSSIVSPSPLTFHPLSSGVLRAEWPLPVAVTANIIRNCTAHPNAQLIAAFVTDGFFDSEQLLAMLDDTLKNKAAADVNLVELCPNCNPVVTAGHLKLMKNALLQQ